MSQRLKWRLRWRLSVLWALEWAITGAILTYMPLYFQEIGLSSELLGQLMAVTAIGLWVAPLIVGQVCDRWMASEKYLAVSHFVGGLTLLSIPIATEMYKETGENFSALIVLVGLYAVMYFPTVPLASALTFRHLADPDEQFGKVRIWGTVGWVLAGLSLSLWLGRADAHDWVISRYPATGPILTELRYAFAWVSAPSSSDCFRIGAILSFALSSFCVFLPASPPSRASRGAIAPLETLRMFRERTFTVLIATSFLLSIVVPFYTLEVPKLLDQLGYDNNWIPAVMTIGQISEFPALLLLAMCLKRFGLKAAFALGMAAWLVRYVFFAFEDPTWLILSAIALHGVCHVFLIIVVQLYVDSRCRPDLRASAQNLFAFITMGIGMPIGFLAGGKLSQWANDAGTGETNYHIFFGIPAAVILVLLLAYWRWFQLDTAEPAAEQSNRAPVVEPMHGDAKAV
jgi:MFS family permease